MSDTNVGLGMVACRKNCWCPDCQIDRLRARVAELEAERRRVARAAEDATEYVLAIANRELRAENARLRAALEAARSTLSELRIRLHASGRRPEECWEMSEIDATLRTTRAEALEEGNG